MLQTPSRSSRGFEVEGAGIGIAIAVVIVLLVIIFTVPFSCTSIQEREVGVYTWNGEIQGESKRAGLHWYNPIFAKIYVYDIGFQELNNGNMTVYKAKSKEMQELEPPIGVTHRLVPEYVTIIHRQVGKDYGKSLVTQYLISALTQRAVQYDIYELHANREAIAQMVMLDVQQGINQVLPNNLMNPNQPVRTRKQLVPEFKVSTRQEPDGYITARNEKGEEVQTPKHREQRMIEVIMGEKDVPIPVIEVQKVVIADWGFSHSIKERIDAKQQAIQVAEQRRNEVEQERAEADKRIQKARGEAEYAKAQADAAAYTKKAMVEAEASSLKAKATAEAEAYERVGQALAKYPAVLQMEWLKRWNGQTPQVLGGSGGFGMLFQMPQTQTQPNQPDDKK